LVSLLDAASILHLGQQGWAAGSAQAASAGGGVGWRAGSGCSSGGERRVGSERRRHRAVRNQRKNAAAGSAQR